MNLVMPTAIPPREMPLSKSITPLKSALPMASISVADKPPSTPMIPLAMVFTDGML